MEPTLTETTPTLSLLTRRYYKLLNILATSMNILGWGTFALFLLMAWLGPTNFKLPFLADIVFISGMLLFYLVPGSLLAFPILLLLALLAVSDDYGTTGIFLKNLPLKNRQFILSGANALLYLAGCLLFIIVYGFLFLGPSAID